MSCEDLSDIELAEVLWEFNLVGTPLNTNTHFDLMLVMGSNDDDVAVFASELALKIRPRFIVCSGGVAHKNDLLATSWDGTEATHFASILKSAGISNVLEEDRAQNTGENITFTKDLLAEHRIKNALLVQKPFMQKRAILTAQKQWREVDWCVVSRPVSFADYAKQTNRTDLISILVGDTIRLYAYGKKGYQVPIRLPLEIKDVLFELISRGFSRHLL